jgi:hypothetical protein
MTEQMPTDDGIAMPYQVPQAEQTNADPTAAIALYDQSLARLYEESLRANRELEQRAAERTADLEQRTADLEQRNIELAVINTIQQRLASQIVARALPRRKSRACSRPSPKPIVGCMPRRVAALGWQSAANMYNSWVARSA